MPNTFKNNLLTMARDLVRNKIIPESVIFQVNGVDLFNMEDLREMFDYLHNASNSYESLLCNTEGIIEEDYRILMKLATTAESREYLNLEMKTIKDVSKSIVDVSKGDRNTIDNAIKEFMSSRLFMIKSLNGGILNIGDL